MDLDGSTKFGDLLRHYRLAAGLTQEELAEKAGVSPNAISDLERGARKRPWRETIRLLAEALQLTSDERAHLEAAARPHTPSTLIAPTSGVAPLPPAISPTNLPLSPTPLIGREHELAALEARLLRVESRLLTLVGPGGVGKTRLAFQLAANVLSAFPDGVFVVSLDPLRDPELVLSAIARTLGIAEVPDRPLLETLKERLGARRLLLVLDNFEHLLSAAPLVADLLGTAAGLKVLATSRTALRLRGERVIVVSPLAIPDGQVRELSHAARTAAIGKYAAVRLFVERAQDVEASFELTSENASAAGAICSRLDGLPLAIELAAARIRLLSPTALLARLERRLPLLTGGPRDLPDRQRTLRDTLAWSHDLLGEAEKIAFRRLAVFVGGCSLDAAREALRADLGPGGAAAVDDAEALGLVEALVSQSLLQRRDTGQSAPRFGMLETVREYGLEQLDASGEGDAVRHWHARFFANLAEEAEPKLATSEWTLWFECLTTDQPNLRSALEWCVAQDPDLGLVLGASLKAFWEITGGTVECRRWLDQLLAVAAPGTRQRARALVGYAEILNQTDAGLGPLEEALAIYRPAGDREGLARALLMIAQLYHCEGADDRAWPVLQEGVTLARECGDLVRLAFALNTMGSIELHRGDLDQAWSLNEESLGIRRRLGHPQIIASSVGLLGNLARLRGDYDRARELFEEGLSLTRAAGGGASPRAGWLVGSLGYLARVQGDLARARTLTRESLSIVANTGSPFLMAGAIMGLGEIAIDEGFAYECTRLIGAYETLSPNTQGSLDPDEKADRDRCLAAARAALGDAEFGRAWAEGQGLTQEQAVTYALEG